MPEPDPGVGPPSDEFVRRRWIPAHRADWTRKCFAHMLESGAVSSSTIYDTYDKARWRARYLRDKIVELELAQKWQMKEHIDRKNGGYVWTVEYIGGRK